jgi:hypothetical protein
MNLDSFENLASLRSKTSSKEKSADPPYEEQSQSYVPRRGLVPSSDLMKREILDFHLERTMKLPFERTIQTFHPRSVSTSPNVVPRLNQFNAAESVQIS